jgi:V/A-type H+-transporting ATPase subunit F
MSIYEMAIVGPKEVVLGFKAIGVKPVEAANSEEALHGLQNLKKDRLENGQPRFAIIFIIESLARAIPSDDYKKVTADALPAIISLPGPEGSTGFGMRRIGQIVEKAIGSNILKD